MPAARTPAVVADLRDALGPAAVTTDERAVLRVIRDNSWLSPVLIRQLRQRQKAEGRTLGVLAVVSPATEEQTLLTAAIAARHRTPVTPRGSGTSNFGLVTPERGGLIVDLRQVRGCCQAGDGWVAGPAGTLQGELERQARGSGQELPLLTTTYGSATAGGWVSGGHVGLGSSVHGAVWDGTVCQARLATAADPPEILTLTGHDVEPVLHTFGAMGMLTHLTFRTVPARHWLEAVALFGSFRNSSEFVWRLSVDPTYQHRVATAQEEALLPAFRPFAELAGRGSLAMLIIDRDQEQQVRRLAESLGGELHRWQHFGETKHTSIAAMVYGHRMLWVKKQFRDAAFLHVYLNPEDPLGHAQQLKARFGDRVLLETKFIRSGWMRQALGHPAAGTLPASVISIVDGERPGELETVMRFCDETGIRYQNPHTSVIEDNGLFERTLPLLRRFKARVDPHNLLNPGKFRSVDTPHSGA